jgi:hypothetical protein
MVMEIDPGVFNLLRRRKDEAYDLVNDQKLTRECLELDILIQKANRRKMTAELKKLDVYVAARKDIRHEIDKIIRQFGL